MSRISFQDNDAAVTMSKFVGILVVLKKETVGWNNNYIPQKVLGSGFIVNKEKGLGVTCYHVLPEEDWKCDIGFYSKDENKNWIVSRIDTSTILKMGEEDFILFQCLNADETVATHFETRPISDRELVMAERVIFSGRPTNHTKISIPGNLHITTRIVVGFISAIYERYADISLPLIKGMSGGPVIDTNGNIVGIALENVRIGLDVEIVVTEQINTTDIKEEYFYGEYQRFGYLLKAQIFLGWLRSVETNYPDA